MFYFPTRDEMVRTLLDPSGTWVEVGVFKGEFAAKLRALNPQLLILVDPWDGPSISGDADGNNVISTDLREDYLRLKALYANDPRVWMFKGRSPDALKGFGDWSVDAIYIDGDHSYTGVMNDLEEAYRIVKPGGWIMGHDYAINPEKTLNRYQFGVKQATMIFCAKHSLEIHALALDGCVSYAIRR